MPRHRLLIFTAMEMEARAIASELGLSFDSRQLVATGEAATNLSIALHVIGIRASHIPQIQFPEEVAGIVLAGLSGGLDPALRCGDVVVDGASDMIKSDAKLPFRLGPTHTCDRILSTPAEKGDVFRRTGALAADMETDIVRKAAEAMGIPFASIRAISDTAEESLDPAVLHLINDRGQLKRGAVAALLIRRPMALTSLLRLGRNSQPALGNLARAVRQLVEGDCLRAFQPAK